MTAEAAALLEVSGLKTRFETRGATITAVNDVTFSVARAEIVGIVGESGSGKSQLLFSLMGLLPSYAVTSGSIRFKGEEIRGRPREELDRLRGTSLAMVFQDPMTALNPYLTVERQLTEVLTYHRGMPRKKARAAALRQLQLVHIPGAERQLDRYPHQLSGGMRQRVVIAMAMLGQPALLLADEPTTALDVTIQAEILDLIAEQRSETGASVLLVTHDLGVVAKLCDRVLVMYAGRVVEEGVAADIFGTPQHPYTAALLEAVPRLDDDRIRPAIEGQPPNLAKLPLGCAYAPRCAYVHDRCRAEVPPLYEIDQRRALPPAAGSRPRDGMGGRAACFLHEPKAVLA